VDRGKESGLSEERIERALGAWARASRAGIYGKEELALRAVRALESWRGAPRVARRHHSRLIASFVRLAECGALEHWELAASRAQRRKGRGSLASRRGELDHLAARAVLCPATLAALLELCAWARRADPEGYAGRWVPRLRALASRPNRAALLALPGVFPATPLAPSPLSRAHPVPWA